MTVDAVKVTAKIACVNAVADVSVATCTQINKIEEYGTLQEVQERLQKQVEKLVKDKPVKIEKSEQRTTSDKMTYYTVVLSWDGYQQWTTLAATANQLFALTSLVPSLSPARLRLRVGNRRSVERLRVSQLADVGHGSAKPVPLWRMAALPSHAASALARGDTIRALNLSVWGWQVPGEAAEYAGAALAASVQSLKVKPNTMDNFQQYGKGQAPGVLEYVKQIPGEFTRIESGEF